MNDFRIEDLVFAVLITILFVILIVAAFSLKSQIDSLENEIDILIKLNNLDSL